MKGNLEQLYRQVIMDHYKNPRNKGLVDSEDYNNIHYKNPSCGDDITVQFKINNAGIIEDIKHDGTGCSICCSSASVMSTLLKGKHQDEALRLMQNFFNMMQGAELKNMDEMEDAVAYTGVAQFPARIKCATLSWKALESGIKGNGDGVEE